ncbi:MAG: hypothetical protein ABL907_22355, partial [Hyphomicrobium sp.]
MVRPVALACAAFFTGLALPLDRAAAEQITIQGNDNVVVPTAIDNDMKPTTTETSPAAVPAPAPDPAPAAAAPPPKKKKPAVVRKKPAPDTATEAGSGDGASPAAAPTRTAARHVPGKGEQSIIALVNDEPVTGFEVRQRSEMMAGGAAGEYVKKNVEGRWKSIIASKNIQAEFQEFAKKRQPKSKEQLAAIQKEFVIGKRNAMLAQLQNEARLKTSDKLRSEALEELIDEKLKMQEAKRVGAMASDEEVDMLISGIAERNKMTKDQLAKNLGGSLDPMKLRIRSTLAWNDVIRRKFGHQIAVASKDVDKFVATSQPGGEEQVELQVQRIRLNMPAKLDQAVQDFKAYRAGAMDAAYVALAKAYSTA